jgi:hypothetical protein
MTDLFVSKLDTSIKRGLSAMLHYAFTGGIITYEFFIDTIGVKELIMMLSPQVMGLVVSEVVGGFKPELAAEQDPEIMGLMIHSNLKKGLTTAAKVCKQISPDDMVKFIPNRQLYELVFGKPATSKTFTAAVLEIIIAENLLGEETPASYLKALKIDKIVHEKTPLALLTRFSTSAYVKASANQPFSATDFLGVYTPEELVKYVDLDDLFAPMQAVAELNKWVDPVVVPKPATSGLPEGVGTPSDYPPPTKSEEEKEIEELEATASSDDVLVLDADDDDKTQILQRDSNVPKQTGRQPPQQPQRRRS